MVIFDKVEDFWDLIRRNTFDKLAEKAGVMYVEVEGVDFEKTAYGVVYKSTNLIALWEKQKQFDADAKKNHPVLFFMMRTYPEFVTDIIYVPRKVYSFSRKYLRHFFVKKHNTVHTGLPIGYWDTDTVLVHAIKTLCVEFVEVECDNMFKICYPEESSKENQGIMYLQKRLNDPDETNESNIQNINNVISVYDWFKVNRRASERSIEEFDDSLSIDEYVKLEKHLYDNDTKFCSLFISSRECLWT